MGRDGIGKVEWRKKKKEEIREEISPVSKGIVRPSTGEVRVVEEESVNE